MNVSLLGLGAMGARMAVHLLDAGHTLTVWNRSPGPADALRQRGARVATTPAEAAQSAEVVLSMVTDDDASRAVWIGPDGALAGLAQGAVAVESSTLTPGRVRKLAQAVGERGASFLDAPVMGSRPQAEAGTLIFLVGGDGASVERVRPLLEAMGGAVHHVGPTGQGAALKLAVNGLYAIQVAAVGEWFHTLRAAGVEADRVVDVLSVVPVTSPAAAGALAAIAAGRFGGDCGRPFRAAVPHRPGREGPALRCGAGRVRRRRRPRHAHGARDVRPRPRRRPRRPERDRRRPAVRDWLATTPPA